ncbi:unnamed protein product [Auanema sp. JU1783]|nr:unnamed protein product [Auanema sp. JU1783]
MGERKGQNFYYPPDFNYKTHGSLNRYHGTHALRERASKLKTEGILIIRFEMPFNIWCLGCHNHVGMGVRYNAEKKKIGMYYTTPLYEFRMKCHLCDNYYVIRTDPKNFDYELVEGCSRQEKRYDPSTIDQLGAVDRTFNQKLAADSMFKAEHEHTDKTTADLEGERLEKIEWMQERFKDDYAANQALRSQFRKGKKFLTEQRAKDDDLLTRASLSIPLAPEDPNDQSVAAMITRYKSVKTFDERAEDERSSINNRRIFSSKPSTSSDPTNSADWLKQSLKHNRDKKIIHDFDSGPSTKKPNLSLGIVRSIKKEVKPDTPGPTTLCADIVKQEVVEGEDEAKRSTNATSGLVADYGTSSDSD